MKLLEVNEEKNTPDSLIVSVPLNSSTNVKIPRDVLGRELPGSSGVINNIATRQTWLNENYDTITIYNLVPKFKKYPIMNIEIGKEYIIDDIKLIPLLVFVIYLIFVGTLHSSYCRKLIYNLFL